MSEFKADVVRKLHAPARKNFKRRRVDIRDKDETWQADLVEMIPYGKENQGYKYLLTVIDIFSKYAWAVPLANKTGRETAAAMESIFKRDKRIPRLMHLDNGKEFYNSIFQALMKKYDIHMYSTFTHLKASICERFNRTLKRKMWIRFSLQGHYNWTKILSELLHEYNTAKHRTINMRPVDVVGKKIQQLKKTVYKNLNHCEAKIKFKEGDKVRISKYKHVFEKGYIPNWTNEIFTIIKTNKTSPVTYKLEDYQGNPIEGCFYQEELLKVKHPDIYLVEKIIKKRGNKVLVKYLGFDDSHNQWINKSAL